MTRKELLEQSEASLLTKGNVVIQAATGVGKSKIALDIIKKTISKEKNIKNPKILFVVAEKAHIKNWFKEVKRWKFEYPYEILCYASFKKVAETYWDFVVFDEAHHLNTEKRLSIFESLNIKHTIFLSATLKDSFVEYLREIVNGDFDNIKYSLNNAFEARVLREPKIILCPLTLNNKDYTETIEISWGTGENIIKCSLKDRWKYLINKQLYPNTKLIIKCTEHEKYWFICDQYEYYKKRFMANSHNEMLRNKWLQLGNKRKLYLGVHKTDLVKRFLPTINNKRFICFCTNIEQAEQLNKDNSIHSKKKSSLKIIDAFNDRRISSLFAVGMAKEGMNLSNIEAGVIVQLDGEERAFIQKFGRALRADNPIQYIFYYKNTRDEEYLNNALQGIDTKYIIEVDYENLLKF